MAYQDPYSALGEGIKSGLQLGTAMQQQVAQKRQQKWENDYKQFASAVELMNMKGVTESMKQKVYNETVKTKWNQWSPNTPLPDWETKEDADTMAPYLQKMNEAFQDAQQRGKKGGFDFKTTHGILSGIASEAYSKATKGKQDEDRITNVKQTLLDSLKFQGDKTQQDKATSKQAGDDEADAVKRSTSLGMAYANLMKTGSIDAQTVSENPSLAPFAAMLQQGKLSPEQVQAVGNVINKERSFLNQRISNPQYRTREITQEEFDYLTQVKKRNPQEILLQAVVTPGAKPTRAAPPMAAAPVPAPATMQQPPMAQPTMPTQSIPIPGRRLY